VTISCNGAGRPPLTYEWKKNGVTLDGQTSSTLTLTNITTSDIGQYECIPSNIDGNHNSSIIQLLIRLPSQDINGVSPQVIVNLLPNTTSGYSIMPSNAKLSLSNSGDLTTTSELDSSDSGTYTISSDDFGGPAFIIDIAVYAPAYIISITGPQTVDVSSNAMIEVIASGIPNVLNYNWTRNGIQLDGETSSTLAISNVTTHYIGTYTCTPFNDRGTTNSSSTTLSVRGNEIC
jgi:hypothetical protein